MCLISHLVASFRIDSAQLPGLVASLLPASVILSLQSAGFGHQFNNLGPQFLNIGIQSAIFGHHFATFSLVGLYKSTTALLRKG
jgi:hypothetical protein